MPWEDGGLVVAWQWIDAPWAQDWMPKDLKGNWNHWAFVGSASDRFSKSYQNGALFTEAIEQRKFVQHAANLQIGGRQGSSFAGAIDEFAIFNAVLTEDDINTIMKKGLRNVMLAVFPSDRLAVTWGRLKSD